ncbi:DNA polymerase III subunit alpha [Eggerthellaceae bacterium zg-1084]|uniref:DNA polymerase III subunit alpha n=1 Tax=Berryella wangjianweii TaxID=2734634 RepID=A0A6M8IX99_9ACTN|nr:DNA polymerase III subunit alpha [Berryella wangjianweii]NPD30762.1 DNA polymerase III subunit alpha [Berryella wangjianweii]QKF07395.1 DNA polymerase III subunit alpha [Berryella wangjianweii]
MAFVHLHNHTEYSLLDGMTKIKDMVRRAADLGMPAVAITDHGVMSGVPELCQACEAVEAETGKKVKPLYGVEVYFTDDDGLRRDGKPRLYHLILLAKNSTGYHNLLKLVSESHVDNFYYKPRTTFAMLQKYGEGVVATSACMAGIVPRHLDQGLYEEAVAWARKLASCFAPGDFYIELQNQGPEVRTEAGRSQPELNKMLDRLARECGFKTVAANDFHYLLQEHADSHDVLLCIGMGRKVNEPDRMRFPNDQFYMKTEEEMRAAFADFPEACDNTIEIAEKCTVELERDSILPRFPLPEGETEDTWFRKRVQEGLVARYGDPVPAEAQERADYEMGVIIQQGFPAYFLIVQEYIEWARSQGIGVGPGRGSAAGAIVAYAMGITDLDPLSNGLLFERFLSPERVEMPDIDVDFEDERRGEVIDHIRDVYGEDHVAGVITYGKLQAKNAVRDAARVLDYPYSVGDRITKLIGDELGITIERALESNPDLKTAYSTDEDVHAVIDAALGIEGHLRNEGVHACATIICRDPMSDHVPMKRDTKGGGIITQYDGHYTPDLGLLKMDFLGLRTLGVLSRACRNVKAAHGIDVVPEQIPTDDPLAFKLMQDVNMDGLFQVEGPLYVSLFRRLPPQRFSDVVASIALNRPGPLESGMVDDYVQVASGKVRPHYYDERLRPLLEETYGTMVYQEQIMQVSMVMSGFSAGKADKLRKAMGKKKLDIMRKLKEDWTAGAIENRYDARIAEKIWDDAEKFAKYAFNKSHSAAYAILVMRTAYMKAHYPNEYMAAVLSSYMGNTDKLIHYIASCNHNGTPVLPPDINSSNVEFTPVEGGIRFGLVGVRGVGRNVADEIIAEREANGPYESLHDFVRRLDSKCYNRKTLEALVKGGAFDSTGYTRKQLMYFVDETPLLESAARNQKDRDAGQVSMFDMFGDDPDSGFSHDTPEPDGVEWPKQLKLKNEKEILKIYVSDHPMRPYERAAARISKHRLGSLVDRKDDIKSDWFVGLVTGVATKLTKTGKRMATFSLEDATGSMDCICFKYDDNADALVDDNIVQVKGKFERSDRGTQIVAYEVKVLDLPEDSDDGRGMPPESLELRMTAHQIDESSLAHLNRLLKMYPGDDRVFLSVRSQAGKVFRTALPLSVDARSVFLRSELHQLLGTAAW